MNRPTGWSANPQAMAMVSKGKTYTGHADLGQAVDVDTWLTPRWILDQLGAFDLDPCAYEGNPGWTGARSNFTKETDGLAQPWEGRVFMNPPYSRTARWLEKHSAHRNGISLVPATLESAVWRGYVWPAAVAILFLTGRTRFCNPDGSTTTGRPLRSAALIAWTAADADVLRRSTIAGVLMTSWAVR